MQSITSMQITCHAYRRLCYASAQQYNSTYDHTASLPVHDYKFKTEDESLD